MARIDLSQYGMHPWAPDVGILMWVDFYDENFRLTLNQPTGEDIIKAANENGLDGDAIYSLVIDSLHKNGNIRGFAIDIKKVKESQERSL